ncbi:uncharacterized protein LOC132556663 [Ylistrum balloti]|uniref:uncharacterized protein LOC132556663 n=1 Tax=Ylistrum balloti TaxID=509963 RepID=UPI0029057EFC|nr:uncharacterized protein LOC132556663 [Ylistrum balloti]
MARTSYTEAEIDDFSLREAIEVAKKNQISTDGLKKLKEIICKLKSQLVEDKRKRDAVITSLDSVAAEDHELRKELHSVYGDLIELLQNVELENENNPLTDLLHRHYMNFTDSLKKEKGRLSQKTSRCPILVLGETGAGKSSFINLLLGEEALPTQLLSNTNVICEIQHSDSYWAILYNTENEQKKISNVEKSLFFKSLADHIQKSNGSQADNTAKYQKAEIYLPCDILKTGLVIVDSPGIGDTPQMTQMVLDYILEASSFIYIINSANAGGVQEERVQDLVCNVLKRAFRDQQDYRPECALFVCNKWDRVPIAERTDVCEDTVKKLTCNTGWPDCKTSQIFCISTTEASYVQKEHPHYVYGQFSLLLEEILRLVPKSREIFLVNSTRLLLNFLDKCIFCIDTRLPKDGMTEEDRKKDIERHKAKFLEIKEGIKIFFKEQKKKLKRKIFEISEDLSKFLIQEEIMEDICDVAKYEKAVRAQTWKEAMICTRAELYTQITSQIQKWERKNGLLDKASKEIGEEFRENFPNFGAQISKTEKKFQDRGNWTVLEKEDEPFIPLSVARRFETLDMGFKVLVGVGMAPVLLLGAILRLPVYTFVELKRKITQLTLQSTFDSSDKKQQEMAVRKYAESVLRSVVDPFNLGPLMIKEVQPLFGYLKNQRVSLTNEVEADLKMIEEAEENKKEADAFKIKFAPVIEKFRKLEGRTLFFFLMHLHKPHTKDIIMESDLVESGMVSEGCLSYIMEAKVKETSRIQGYTTVAVRHSKVAVDASNIRQVLNDDKAYRFSTLVHTLGCVKTATKISQVMQPLQHCLRKHLSSPVSSLEKPRYLFHLAEDVVKGLGYLNQRGYVHMDLSLDTIMVDVHRKVKLVNLTMPRKLPVTLFPPDGSPVLKYVHFDGRLMNQPDKTVYTIQHDMYSVGIMMYEMWTGHRAFQDRIEGGIKLLGQLVSVLKENNFNAFQLLKKETDLASVQVWVDTIESCLYGKVKDPEVWLKCMSEMSGRNSVENYTTPYKNYAMAK